MALNIPMPALPLSGLNQAISTGGNLFSQMMNPVLQRENMAKQWREHLDAQAMQREQMAHARRNDDMQRALWQQQLIRAKHANDPRWPLEKLNAVLNGLGGLEGLGAEEQYEEKGMPSFLSALMNPEKKEFGEGEGVMPNENPFLKEVVEDERNQPVVPRQHKSAFPSGINLNEIKKALAYQALGLKMPASERGAGGYAYHGAARDAYDLERLRQEVGESSPVYKNAKAQYDSSLEAKSDLRDLRARTKAGLKSGEKEFFDPNTGVPLGKEINLTPKEREAEEGNNLFNEFYPYVYKGASPFSGEGSIRRLENAAAHYKTDPQARKMFDDLLLADKVLAATVVNEAATLKAGKTNQTFNRLKESLEAGDVPKTIKRLIKEYQIPPSAQLKAGMRYQKLLSDARKEARKKTPATQKLFYDPEMQARYEAQKNELGTENQGSFASQSKNLEGKVIVVDPNGKRFETTEANAAHLPKGWKRG